MPQRVRSYDPLQPNYAYWINPDLRLPEGFDPDFSPEDMIKMGVFGCGYFEGYTKFKREFPHLPKIIETPADHEKNYFGVNASMSRREWQRKGWMHEDDPRGWFQWYCRFCMGRRHSDDERQIKRWKAFKKRKLREIGGSTQITHRAATRQGLLHWGIASPGMVAYEVKRYGG